MPYGHNFQHLRPRPLDFFKIQTWIFRIFTITACRHADRGHCFCSEIKSITLITKRKQTEKNIRQWCYLTDRNVFKVNRILCDNLCCNEKRRRILQINHFFVFLFVSITCQVTLRLKLNFFRPVLPFEICDCIFKSFTP